MKRSPFALIAFTAALITFIPAVFIAIADLLQLPESNPFVAFAFPIVAIFSMPEAPAQMLPFYVGFPVIVPAIAFICAAISFRKKEERQSMAFAAVVLAIVTIALHLFVRWMSA